MKNSVVDISKECDKLLEISNELSKEKLEVAARARALKKSMAELQELYKDENYDEGLLAKAKLLCEQDAIQLEYVLRQYNYELKTRYEMRSMIITYYARVMSANKLLVRFGYPEELRNLLIWSKRLRELAVPAARHISFDVTEKDKQLLLDIKEVLRNLPKEVSACIQSS